MNESDWPESIIANKLTTYIVFLCINHYSESKWTPNQVSLTSKFKIKKNTSGLTTHTTLFIFIYLYSSISACGNMVIQHYLHNFILICTKSWEKR